MHNNNLLRKQIENERWKKKVVVYTLLLLVVAYLFFNLLFDDTGVIKYIHLKSTEQRLLREIASIQRENDRIQDEIKNLESNPFYIEKHAREDLNFARPDEFIFLYGPEE